MSRQKALLLVGFTTLSLNKRNGSKGIAAQVRDKKEQELKKNV